MLKFCKNVHVNVPAQRRYHHNLRSTDGLTVLTYWLEIVTIFVHYQPSFTHFTHNGTQWPTAASRCRFALQDVSCRESWHLAILGSPRVTILSASPVRMLDHFVVKCKRPSDLKTSLNVSLPFALITGPATDPSSMVLLFNLYTVPCNIGIREMSPLLNPVWRSSPLLCILWWMIQGVW